MRRLEMTARNSPAFWIAAILLAVAAGEALVTWRYTQTAAREALIAQEAVDRAVESAGDFRRTVINTAN